LAWAETGDQFQGSSSLTRLIGWSAPEGERADRAFGGVVGHFEPAVVDEAGEGLPARGRIADGAGERALAADLEGKEDGGEAAPTADHSGAAGPEPQATYSRTF
jgi:hypothetical protein